MHDTDFPDYDDDELGVCYECNATTPIELLIETDTQYICDFCEDNFQRNLLFSTELEDHLDFYAELLQMGRL